MKKLIIALLLTLIYVSSSAQPVCCAIDSCTQDYIQKKVDTLQRKLDSANKIHFKKNDSLYEVAAIIYPTRSSSGINTWHYATDLGHGVSGVIDSFAIEGWAMHMYFKDTAFEVVSFGEFPDESSIIAHHTTTGYRAWNLNSYSFGSRTLGYGADIYFSVPCPLQADFQLDSATGAVSVGQAKPLPMVNLLQPKPRVTTGYAYGNLYIEVNTDSCFEAQGYPKVVMQTDGVRAYGFSQQNMSRTQTRIFPMLHGDFITTYPPPDKLHWTMEFAGSVAGRGEWLTEDFGPTCNFQCLFILKRNKF